MAIKPIRKSINKFNSKIIAESSYTITNQVWQKGYSIDSLFITGLFFWSDAESFVKFLNAGLVFNYKKHPLCEFLVRKLI
jgi:hypothetical protein